MKIFRPGNEGAARETQTQREENPYLSARRSWDSHVGSVIAGRNMWRIIALAALMIVLAAVGGIIHIGSQSKFVPYVVEVDKLGQVRGVQPAVRPGAIDPNVMESQLVRFVEAIRTVSPDLAMQRRSIFVVYSMLPSKSSAFAKANTWYQGEKTNPRKRAERETVTIEVTSVLPQTANTWQVDWKESIYDRTGVLMTPPFLMRALLTTRIIAPDSSTSEEQVRNNPLGIYVQDFNWSKPL